jgi:hypothetical protein
MGRARFDCCSEKFERNDVGDLCQHHIDEPHFLAEFGLVGLHSGGSMFDDPSCG